MTYTITGKEPKDVIDWVKVGRPEEIVIPDGHTEPVHFVNILGSKESPVLISGGSIKVPVNLSFGVKFDSCRHFIFASCDISGGHIGVTLEKRTTDFELRYLNVTGSGAVGILAKDDSALRGQFTMTGKIHHCHVEKSGTEGIYVGNSHWVEGKAHECENVHIYSNIVIDSGWDGIQLGSCVRGASIYDNEVTNAGTKRATNQSNGIQIGEGTGGQCFKNIIHNTAGNGIICLGLGNNLIYDNEMYDCQESGIFADTRGTPTGTGFKIYRNKIERPKADGIRLFAKLPDNVVIHNTIVNPGIAFLNIFKGITGTFGPNFMIRE